ncbi:MAG: MBL fold metallo-hydrolase [Lachnospiraceae bacterium]|nr:MBL fold metallo-hydrolase [Lachnospiraceae bacterium]
MKITILGVRGSIPTSGEGFLEYGGATACCLVEAGDQAIYLDAGSGLLHSPDTGDRKVSLLITHTHMDHILGLPLSPLLLSHRRIDLYAKTRDGLDARQQLERLMSPPLWPVGVDIYPSDVVFHDIGKGIQLGNVYVDTMESNHPGGSTIFKLEHEGKSLVYATDYEHSEDKQAELAEFAKDTDLLLYDAQYTDEEYERMKGFGHSTVFEGMKLFEKSGAKRILFVHHDPRHNDDKLKEMEAGLKDTRAGFAREGMVLEL